MRGPDQVTFDEFSGDHGANDVCDAVFFGTADIWSVLPSIFDQIFFICFEKSGLLEAKKTDIWYLVRYLTRFLN